MTSPAIASAAAPVTGSAAALAPIAPRRRLAAAVARPDRLPQRDARLGTRAAVALIGALAVLGAGWALRASTWDLALTHALNVHRTGALGALTTGFYRYLEPPYAAALALVLVAVLAWRTSVRRALAVALAAGGTYVPVVLIKAVVARPRPTAALLAHPIPMHPGDWSYTSGHTAFVASMGLAFLLATWDTAARRWMPWAAGLAVCVMGASVLVDGVHYPTDVLGSLVWAAAVMPLAWPLAARAADALL